MNDQLDGTIDDFERALAESLRVEAGRAPQMPSSWSGSALRVVGTPSSGAARRTVFGGRRAGMWVAVAACVSLITAALVVLDSDGTRLVPAAIDGETIAESSSMNGDADTTSVVDRTLVDDGSLQPAGQATIDESVTPLDPVGLLHVDWGWFIRLATVAIEDEIHECMAGAGFDYRSIGSSDDWEFEPVFKDAAHRAAYGYGPSFRSTSSVNGQPAPQPSHLAASPAEYNAQFDDPAAWAAYMGSDPDAQMGGCVLEAYSVVYPGGVAVPPDNDAWNEVVSNFDATTYGSVELTGDLQHVRRVLVPLPSGISVSGDQQLLDIAVPWSACMRRAGIEVTTPHDLEAMADRLRVEVPDESQLGGVVSPAETDVAMIDLQCQAETGITATWYERIAERVQAFAEQHAELIQRIRAWYEDVAARAAAVERRLAG